MARTRSIRPQFFQNEDLADLPMETRMLFIGLWTLADRRGRLEDRPRRIKAALFPYDEVRVNEALDDLAMSGFLIRYKATLASGEQLSLIQVVNFEKHQRVSGDECKKESEYPAPMGYTPPEATTEQDDTTSEARTTEGNTTKTQPKKEVRSKEEASTKHVVGRSTEYGVLRTENGVLSTLSERGASGDAAGPEGQPAPSSLRSDGPAPGEDPEDPPGEEPPGAVERAKKPQRHKRGKYSNVLLTDEELANLRQDHPNADEAVEYLSEYRAMKGYSCKSDNLALRKWVFDALEEQAIRRRKLTLATPAQERQEDILRKAFEAAGVQDTTAQEVQG